jgi:hypothetical protein
LRTCLWYTFSSSTFRLLAGTCPKLRSG